LASAWDFDILPSTLAPDLWKSFTSKFSMSRLVQELKSRLKGTWIHHAVWAYRNPPLKTPGHNEISGNYRNANYDRQTVEVMFRVLRRNSNCLDLGAHGGKFLEHMIAIAPQGRHYAFEALPHIAQKLRERFPQANVYPVAVSDRSGESDFQFVENDPGYSGLRRREYDRPDPKITTIRVRVVTLDEIIPRNEKIAFIKIDIEGGEFHAIKGGIETIRRGMPVIVFEADSRSTGQYGVKPEDVYFLLTDALEYDLSTMERWLKRKKPYTLEEFDKNWYQGPEFYYLASPKR
jgi:FkbM family methyltransferase